MQVRSLLYGLIGFFLGGFLVAIAATTFNKADSGDAHKTNMSMSSMSMDSMAADLKNKMGDEFDKAFIANMTAHHQGAIEMAKLSAEKAKHQEIKTLSERIISAQEKEILEMSQWQMDWGYPSAMDH